jgi:hypothetical protein
MTQRYEIFWTSKNGNGAMARIVEKHEIGAVTAEFLVANLEQCADEDQGRHSRRQN